MTHKLWLQKQKLNYNKNVFDIIQFGSSTRENNLFHGISLIDKKFFSEKLRFIPKIQIYYSLERMGKNEKIKFNYMLSGRGGKYGLLKKYNGNLIRPGLVEISPNYENIFIEKISALTKKFRIKKVLVSSESK